jgi:formylglycine-generating enzyme required for sulfatase activity
MFSKLKVGSWAKWWGAALLWAVAWGGPRAVAEEDHMPGPAYTETLPRVGVAFDMVPIPAGTVLMGSPDDEEGRGDDEGPQFAVDIEPFWMGKYEVTWDEYQRFRDEYARAGTAHVLDRKEQWQGTKWSDQWADAVSVPTPLWEQDVTPILNGMGCEGGYPVVDISNYAARQYTKWLSKQTGRFYRLPTEAEWEYAARAGSTGAYSFGDDGQQLGDHAWYFENSLYEDPAQGHPEYGAGYRKVGEKKPNPWGLHDMYGNVSEWVLDAYVPDHYRQFAGKTVPWQDAIAWPKTIFPRVVRGGNWNSEAAQCRSAARLGSDPSWQMRDPQLPKSIWWYTDAFHVGFRVICPLREPSEKEKLKYWDANTDAVRFVVRTNDKIMRIMIDPDEQAERK